MHQEATPQIVPFDFNGTHIRTLADDEGTAWFVLKDVCDVLDIANPRNASSRIHSQDKGVHTVDTPGGKQKTTIVNESGLYDVILDSRKPQARDFRRWVTSDVIPSIRKHGGYLTGSKLEEVLTDPDTLIKLATDLKREREKREELEYQQMVDAPKVLFADAVATSNTDILVGDLAKILRGNGINIGATRLFKWLRQNGFLINRKGTGWNMPTQKAMDLELFRIKETTITHSDGHISISKTPKVTGKGQRYFIERFLNGTFSTTKAA